VWQLIVRSHEGPDARDKRSGMEDMDKGYTIDHVVKAGKLITLFSAPDYPQFQATEERYNNKGAYIVLEAPDFSKPQFFEFDAIKPRPKAKFLILLLPVILIPKSCLILWSLTVTTVCFLMSIVSTSGESCYTLCQNLHRGSSMEVLLISSDFLSGYFDSE
jgi:hypothetical protein